MENLENKAEKPVSAQGSKSQKFPFLFLVITPLSIFIKLYAKIWQWYAGWMQDAWRSDTGHIRASY